MNKTPVILVCGVAEEPMMLATVALQWDLPGAVVMHHTIDPKREVLVRVISDVTGVLEREEIDVEHACISCAIREDILPTLERLAALDRWESIIAHLPVTAEPIQVCRVLGMNPDYVSGVKINAVVTALAGQSLKEDLLGDDHVSERELNVREDDDRGIAEVTASMIEYADQVVITEEPSTEAYEFVAALARPDTFVAKSVAELDASVLREGIHQFDISEEWVSETRQVDVGERERESVWVLDFATQRPFHPERLQRCIVELGSGRYRARGCFWLPSRPDQVCVWDGAGGQLTIGSVSMWGSGQPMTRIVCVGLEADKEEVLSNFEACLLTEQEINLRGIYWEMDQDGFEPWLGPIGGRPLRSQN